MKQLLPGIWQWSWFSQEKQIDFNGLFLTVGEHRVLVDPPPMTPEEVRQSQQGGPIDYILLTNRDHQREGMTLQSECKCRVIVPAADASQMEIRADKTYEDGELLPGGIWAIHLRGQKSPGESALFLQQGKGILIVGDALIGAPPGSLKMLPPEKYADPVSAREGLQRLRRYEFDTILVGDGASILTGAKAAVERALVA